VDRYFRFEVGESEVVALSDGLTSFPSDFLMVGVGESERLEACGKHKLDPVEVPSYLNVILVKLNGQTLLFDTGAGSTMPGCGTLQDSLAAAGISADSVGHVIHTHLHLDHVGGNVDALGEPAFPNARYMLGQTEWDFWSDEETLLALEKAEIWKLPDFEPAMAAATRDQILAIKDRVEVFPDGGEPVPGVHAIPAFGHTPGHLAFRIDLGSEELYITGDLVLSPFHVDHADWFPAVDLWPEMAIASRARIFGEAAAKKALVSGYHLPFPGLGTLSVGNDGWVWEDVYAEVRR
jgi:glyoxylase-like metal-dependent hydrolase (beta-lactamase superfamily II)